MLYSLTITIDDSKILIASSNGSVLTDLPNVITLNENDKIVEIGETKDSFRERHPQWWEKIKDKVRFCKLFSTNELRPELIASAINLLAYLATHQTIESKKKWTRDRIELHLNIFGYTKLDKTFQELFEYHVQERGFVRIKSLFINNQEKALGKIRLAEWTAKLGVPIAPILILILVNYAMKIIMGESYSAPIPNDEKWSIGAYVMIASLLLYYTGFVFSVAIWKFGVQNLISESISRKIIERNKLGLPNFLMNLLWKKPFSQSDSG